jgi:Zn-dependent metalloprotease
VLGKDPQPGHMDDFVRTNQDNGGVHINSGIPNRAFYLAARAIGGNAWDRAGRVWYNALLDPNTRANTDFAGFARVTIDVAGRLYGSGSAEATAVTEAWTTVGVI